MRLPKLARSRPASSPSSSPSPSPSPSPPPKACSPIDDPRPKRLRLMQYMHVLPRITRSRSNDGSSARHKYCQEGGRASASRSSTPAAAAAPSSSSRNSAHAASPSSRLTCGALRELREAFAQFDANGDGRISPEELCSVLRSLTGGGGGDDDTWRCTPHEASLMVAELDSDGDGFIDLHDFVALNVGPTQDEIELSEDDLAAAFHVFDSNKDGLITAEEIHTIMGAMKAQQTWAEQPASSYSLDDCKRMIAGVDRKGTGCVDFDDFKRMMTMASA